MNTYSGFTFDRVMSGEYIAYVTLSTGTWFITYSGHITQDIDLRLRRLDVRDFELVMNEDRTV